MHYVNRCSLLIQMSKHVQHGLCVQKQIEVLFGLLIRVGPKTMYDVFYWVAIAMEGKILVMAKQHSK